MRKMDSDPFQRGWRNFGGIMIASGALALAGCGGGGKSPETTTPLAGTTQPSDTSTTGSEATLTFDSLDQNQLIIEVYPGPKNTPDDRKFNGTYNSGDQVGAECKTEGRTVNSVPGVDREDRTSNEWVRIQGSPGETQYATAVYVENPQELLGQLPNC